MHDMHLSVERVDERKPETILTSTSYRHCIGNDIIVPTAESTSILPD